MNSKKSKVNPLRTWALPVGLSVAGLGLTAVGIIFLVKHLKKEDMDDDADVENFDIVKNKPFFI